MAIHYRPARVDDLDAADAVVVASINDLTERHGFGTMAVSRPPQFQRFSLADDPAGLWIAEEDGAIAGFAWSWACGEFWFLAQLFVKPDRQGAGIGNALLGRALAHAAAAGASEKALITFTFNTVSQSLYMRHGLFPRFPIYVFGIERERLRQCLAEPELRVQSLDQAPEHLRTLTAIDREALGFSREKHHRFLLADAGTRGLTLHQDGACVGYAYVGRDGHIGPLAVTRADLLAAAFRTALSVAAAGDSPQVSAFLPGTADAALREAAVRRMRLRFPMLFMSTRQAAGWTQYLPRNPGFM